MRFLIFCLAACTTLFSFHEIAEHQDPMQRTYFSYLDKLGVPSGNYQRGEIQIVVDPSEIAKIEAAQKENLIQKGMPQTMASKSSHVGIIAEDQYMILLRDAVYFPSGATGTYDRLIWKSCLKQKSSGVAVLPVLPSGEIVLNLNYRHATRSWELEIPRGLPNLYETNQQTALRELKEETGLEAESVVFLGQMTPDTGMLSSVIPVFIGFVSAEGDPDFEDSEAIAGTLSFTKEAIKAGLLSGALEVTINGRQEIVPLRDPFLTFALYQASLRDLL